MGIWLFLHHWSICIPPIAGYWIKEKHSLTLGSRAYDDLFSLSECQPFSQVDTVSPLYLQEIQGQSLLKKKKEPTWHKRRHSVVSHKQQGHPYNKVWINILSKVSKWLFKKASATLQGNISLYSRPSLSAGSASVNSTNGRSKIEKIPKSNLSLPHAGNNLHHIYIVFTTIYIVFTPY